MQAIRPALPELVFVRVDAIAAPVFRRGHFRATITLVEFIERDQQLLARFEYAALP